VLADIFTHKVDYADLYFQYTRNEAWSLEEGIVKSGSFSIDQGVGVRAVSGDKTAFAYSDDISLPALRRPPRPPARSARAAAGASRWRARSPRTRAAPLCAERSARLDDATERWRCSSDRKLARARIRAWCR
jgi:predicted Zn-dependent protease